MAKPKRRLKPMLANEPADNRNALTELQAEEPEAQPTKVTVATEIAAYAADIRACLKAGHSFATIAARLKFGGEQLDGTQLRRYLARCDKRSARRGRVKKTDTSGGASSSGSSSPPAWSSATQGTTPPPASPQPQQRQTPTTLPSQTAASIANSPVEASAGTSSTSPTSPETLPPRPVRAEPASAGATPSPASVAQPDGPIMESQDVTKPHSIGPSEPAGSQRPMSAPQERTIEPAPPNPMGATTSTSRDVDSPETVRKAEQELESAQNVRQAFARGMDTLLARGRPRDGTTSEPASVP